MDRFQGPLLSYVLAILRHLQDAEDVVQETLLRAHASVGQIREAAALWGWLKRIAHNAAIDAARKSGRNGIPTDPAVLVAMADSRPENKGENPEEELSLDAIVRAIEGLPATYREAAVYHYLLEWPYQKIAGTLGIDPAAARQRISRAGKMLRGALCQNRDADRHDM